MTDMIVFNANLNSLDIHTLDKRACSGYSNNPDYGNLKLLLRIWPEKHLWTHRTYKEYSGGFKPITPVFLVRWSDE